MKMNKFKYYIEMALNESKKNDFEINAIIDGNNNNKFPLYKDGEYIELKGNIAEDFNKKLGVVVDNIDNISIFDKLQTAMKELIYEFETLHRIASENPSKKKFKSLEIEAIVPIDDTNKVKITINRSDLKLTIEKK